MTYGSWPCSTPSSSVWTAAPEMGTRLRVVSTYFPEYSVRGRSTGDGVGGGDSGRSREGDPAHGRGCVRRRQSAAASGNRGRGDFASMLLTSVEMQCVPVARDRGAPAWESESASTAERSMWMSEPAVATSNAVMPRFDRPGLTPNGLDDQHRPFGSSAFVAEARVSRCDAGACRAGDRPGRGRSGRSVR